LAFDLPLFCAFPDTSLKNTLPARASKKAGERSNVGASLVMLGSINITLFFQIKFNFSIKTMTY
jgi:hypothetical protein